MNVIKCPVQGWYSEKNVQVNLFYLMEKMAVCYCSIYARILDKNCHFGKSYSWNIYWLINVPSLTGEQ